MKVVTGLILLLPFVFGKPATEDNDRFIDYREYDPYYKRYIPMKREDGEIKIVDLLANATDSGAQLRVSLSDVEYDLYTKSNRLSATTIKNNNVAALANSNFDPNKLSVFVAHGWTNSRSSEINILIRSGIWNGGYDVNLFIVDWNKISRWDYLTAKSSVREVGAIVGNFVKLIQSTYGLGGSSFVLIGHSLGAHVMGNAGAEISDQVSLIIGLDPAGPLFTILNTRERLDPTDAKIVEVIHTNGAVLGMSSSIGDIDYFPDGGLTQSGCIADVTGYCSHMRSYKYLAESFERGSAFVARKCSTYTAYTLGLCITNEKSVMGLLNGSGSTNGDYYLRVNSLPPYGKS